MADTKPIQELEALKKRHEALQKRKNSNEGELRAKKQQLEELQAQAVKSWGTHEVAELEAKLEQFRRENEQMCREYQASLDQIEAKLAEIDRRYDDAKGQAAAR